MARLNAESQILREMVLLPPEPGHPEAETDDTPTWPRATEWLPMELTPDHPRYHDQRQKHGGGGQRVAARERE